jgi:O-antigen biosynthesis protein
VIQSWDAIIINFNGELFLDPCLRAITRGQNPPNRILLVDNASSDESLKELHAWPDVEVVALQENRGYAGGANAGAELSESDVLVFLNPDVELDPSFGRELIRVFSSDSCLGAAGGKLLFPESSLIQHAGGVVHRPELTTSHRGERQEDTGQFDSPADVDYLTGAALAVRREAFTAVDGFDESYFPAYWEDVDLCFRLREAGWGVQYRPELLGIHHEGSGLEREASYFEMWTRNRLRFAQRHLEQDEWWRQFVPAEIERLRGEISAIESDDWYSRSGALTIERAARSDLASDVTAMPSAVRADRLVNSISAIRELGPLADPSPPPPGPADGVTRRLKRFLSRFSGRIYVEELYWQQRQFNEAVVRAIEAQDRLNRELVADLLLTLLIITDRRQVDSQSTYQRDADKS